MYGNHRRLEHTECTHTVEITHMLEVTPPPATQFLTILLVNAKIPTISSLLQQQSKSKMNIGFPSFLFPVHTDLATICKI